MELTGRLTRGPRACVAGDFFKDPLPEADLYILARVLHDWTDAKCCHLLQRLYRACRTGRWRGRWAPGPGLHSGQRYQRPDALRAHKARHGDADVRLSVRRLPSFSRHHHVPGSLLSSLFLPHVSTSPPAKLRFSKYGDIFRSEVFHGGLCLEPFGGGALGSVLRRSELFMFECELKLLDGEFVFFFFLTLCRGMFETLVL